MASIAMLMKINSVYCATLAGLDMFSPQSATAFFAPVASVLKLGDPDKSDEKTAYMRATCLAALMVYCRSRRSRLAPAPSFPVLPSLEGRPRQQHRLCQVQRDRAHPRRRPGARRRRRR
ncbi:hypothetical protein DFJ74DRAFT_296343 [Hyaloraphidium curvatum]|nr:hypothetical protein DFJ74DRAFT_296343 [Hyaloraphidium curvatum]